MANLVIDIGNSSTKLAVFESNEIIDKSVCAHATTEFITKLIKTHQIKQVIISSVKGEIGFEITSKVDLMQFCRQTRIPIKNKYETPESLGSDRLAAVIGANALYPNQDVLVIDAGTCITYDCVSANAEYLGGSISPGIKMRFEAMHHFTKKLPLVAFDNAFDQQFGKNSNDAISSGAINGAIYEVDGFIKQYLNTHPLAKIILCGGDSAFFDTKFKNSIFANLILHEPDLVLIGLNTVVNYQHDLK